MKEVTEKEIGTVTEFKTEQITAPHEGGAITLVQVQTENFPLVTVKTITDSNAKLISQQYFV